MRYQVVLRVFCALGLFLGGVSAAFSLQVCPAPDLDRQGAGPWDYTDPQYHTNPRRLPLVEQHHFMPEVEFLRRSSTRTLGQSISFTLRASPNHHRALRSMTQLVQRTDSLWPQGLQYSMDCWFSRARRFQPNDGMVPMIHGMYYYDIGEYEEALERMQEGLALEPDNRNILYNIGLVYMELDRYEEAREHARKAYDAGFPLEGLRRQLQAAGEW